MNFETTMERLNHIKTLYYKLTYAIERPSYFNESLATYAPGMRDFLVNTLNHITEHLKNDPSYSFWPHALIAIDELTMTVAPRGKRGDIRIGLTEMDDADGLKDPFYYTANFGKFWNEVPLPDCIENFFKVYAENVIKPCTSGMLGVEGTRGTAPKGAWAISYYDLSDIAIVFESELVARDFADANLVEPCQFMTCDGEAWHCH